MVPDEVDAVLQKFLQIELVGEPQDGHTVGEIEVPDHELHTPLVQLLRLEIVGGLQEILDVIDGDISLAGVCSKLNH